MGSVKSFRDGFFCQKSRHRFYEVSITKPKKEQKNGFCEKPSPKDLLSSVVFRLMEVHEMRFFEWLQKQRIVIHLLKLGLGNLICLSLAFAVLSALMGILNLLVPRSLIYDKLANSILYDVAYGFCIVSVILFGLALFILCLSVFIFAVVEYHDHNINRSKE